MPDVYLYGMTLLTTSYLLKSDFPKADTYAEITESYTLPGGETGAAAIVLANLGANVKIDGNHLGLNTYHHLIEFLSGINVDASRMTFDPQYEGLQDHVIIDRNTRTCFGKFQQFFSDPDHRRWNTPLLEDIEAAKVVGLDPFFFEDSVRVADYCKQLNKKYVVIDCKYDSFLHQYCAVNVISNEFIKNNYQDADPNKLFYEYTNRTSGLVIFTFGGRDIFYGRRGEEFKRFKPYTVDVVSTLGAGDTFKAGAIYGLFKGFNDRELVSFAAATAAIACSQFPLPLNPPSLNQIIHLQQSR